jgi:predicted DNA binding protein
MGQDRKSATAQETFSSEDRVASGHERRHVLPKDLPNAVKHLNDDELDRLLFVTLAEAKRRGRHTTPTDKHFQTRTSESAVSLTRGQLNAVRAAFQAGITPARIARQFGLSQSDVKKALKFDKRE